MLDRRVDHGEGDIEARYSRRTGEPDRRFAFFTLSLSNFIEPYRIALPQFEGPFDLLLFFIERDEIDISNIPVAKITDDFLGYVRDARALDITLAGDFIVVAATLMSIKARVLLPRLEKDEAGQDVDPRRELVERLIEYRRYRGIIEEMRRLEQLRGERFARPLVAQLSDDMLGEARAEAEWESVTLYKLLRAFERVLARQADREERPVHRVMRWPHTVEEERERILRSVRLRGEVPFDVLFGACVDRVHAIVTFLALLELLNAARVRIRIHGEAYNHFMITEPTEDAREPAARGVESFAEDAEVTAVSRVESER